MKKLRMFMWQWQHVFQKAVELLLEEIFKILELQPSFEVFVLGIPVDGENIEHVYFQPEDWGVLQKEFREVFKTTKNYYENDPEQNLMMGAAHLDEAHKKSLYPKSLRRATQEILESYETGSDKITFCSFPVIMNNHWVMTVIQLDKKFYDQHYHLQSKSFEIRPMRFRQLDGSFFEAIVWETLSACQRELLSPSQGQHYWFANVERLFEDAASSLLSSIRFRVNEMGGDLLTLSNAISAERYEGAGSRGRLIVVYPDSPDINVHIRLKDPIDINNYRGIRKLLEVSSNSMALLCDGESIWGLGNPLNSYDSVNENLFELRFTEHYTWELVHADNVMLRVRYRQPRLPKERFDKAQFYDHVGRLFKVSKDKSDILIEGVEGAINQRHGTMLVITPKAFEEANRLSAQSTIIKPIVVTQEIISHISSVDGAILISPDGVIFGFGVILDGLASENGNPARGARFNSAIRYVDGQIKSGTSCLALIVSEDGYVDIYPKLRPRIPRKLIDDLLGELEFYAGPIENFNPEKAWPTLINLGKLRFYLLDEDVIRANSVKEVIVKRENEHRAKEILGTGMGYINPQIDGFSVFEEMNLEYYLPEDHF